MKSNERREKREERKSVLTMQCNVAHNVLLHTMQCCTQCSVACNANLHTMQYCNQCNFVRNAKNWTNLYLRNLGDFVCIFVIICLWQFRLAFYLCFYGLKTECCHTKLRINEGFLVQACLRAPPVVADEAKLAIVFTYFFLFFFSSTPSAFHPLRGYSGS